jgi:CRISPR-associated helicase Cas3/CRISPR-associated endonuclease Cas3-HD
MIPPHEAWLPLWQHLDDAADIAGMLWDAWVPLSIRSLIGGALPGGEPDGRCLLGWLAGVHDVGKATPAFAVQVSAGEVANRPARAGLRIGPMVQVDRSMLRHEIAGAAILERWLAERTGLGKFARRQLTEVVAAHHGSFPPLSRVQDAPSHAHLMGDRAWTAVQDDLLDRTSTRIGAAERWPDWAEIELPQPVQMILTGLVVMADWIASGDGFPLLPLEVVPLVAADDAPSLRARRAWQELDLGLRWVPHPLPADAAERFVDRFPGLASGPRPIQRVAAERAASMLAPGLMIIEAPMGEGKTEAGFLAAEILAARTGATGCFVALPTQATSNAMFHRMLGWLGRLPDSGGVGTQTVALVHGKASLNEEYMGVRFGRPGRAPVYDGDALGGVPGQDGARLRAAVSEWMTGRKRAALSSFVVGTIDQVLFGALRARHVMLRQLSLAGKVVVIDEVHAADVFMSTFLDRALEWLGAAGTPVVLMSATLPAARRAELYLAYERGRRLGSGGVPGDPDVSVVAEHRLSGDIGYPVVVTTGADGPDVTVLPRLSVQVPVVLHRLDDDLTGLVDLLRDRLRDGGCAVVVRNTVRRAQEAAAAVTEAFGADRVTLAHAQFLAVDRAANDADLLARFGPPGDGVARPPLHVVVATQVVEQSLDVDFDLMVTDVAPADLVLQRIGRLHRHRRGAEQTDRPAPVRSAACYLTGVDWAATPPAPDRGAAVVYGRWPLLRALAVLGPHLDGAPIRLPGDIAPLVQDAYGLGAAVPAGWVDAMEEAWRTYVEAQAMRKQRAQDFALPPVGPHGRDLYDLSHVSVGDVDEDSPAGQACVRDGGESVEVVVVQRGEDGTDRIPDWVPSGGETLPFRHVEVPARLARVLAGCTLRLPFRLTQPQVIDQVIAELERDWFEGWQRTPLLTGQLALVLDDRASATLAGHVLRYDRRLGLVVEAQQ